MSETVRFFTKDSGDHFFGWLESNSNVFNLLKAVFFSSETSDFNAITAPAGKNVKCKLCFFCLELFSNEYQLNYFIYS